MCEVVIYEQDQDDYYLLQMLTIFLNTIFFTPLKNLKKKLPISTDTFPKIAYLPDVRALCDATL